MNNRLCRIQVLTLLAVACGPAPQASETQPDDLLTEIEARALVDDMLREWDAANLAGDFEAAAAMYTEDAIRMGPGSPAIVGRDAIRAWLAEQAEQYTFEGSNQTLEVTVLGPEWIMLTNTSDFTRTPKAGGQSTPLRESWLTLVERQPDGSWKWYRDAGSSDLPR